MTVDIFQPTFIIQVEGQTLTSDITHEVTSLVFEDNEKEMDVLELSISNRNLQFVDHPLFQEGNEVVARFGYVNNLTPRKKTVIKDIDYDFPESGAPTIRIKAYDKGFKLAGKENQKIWQKPAPGILYSEIAEEIAKVNGLAVARMGDLHSCPIPGHGVTPIITGSPTTITEGQPNARIGDVTGCGATIVTGSLDTITS